MLTRSQVNLTESGTLKPQESRTITLQTTYLVRKIILSRCGGVNNIHLSNYRRSLINRKQYHFWNCACLLVYGCFFQPFLVQYHMLQPNKLLFRCNPSTLPSSSIRMEIFLQIWKICTFQIVCPYVAVTHSLPILFIHLVWPKLIFLIFFDLSP